MRTTITRIALTLLAVLIGSTMLAASPGALAPGEVRYVVTLAAGAHTPDIAALGGRLEAIDGSVLTVVLPAQAAKALANDPAVQSMEEASQRATATAPSHRLENDRFRLTPQDAITLWGSGEYVYDGAGNITAMGITGALNNDGKTSAFTYDLASRLKTASIGRASGGDIIEAYSYDGFGNLTAHQRTSPDSITYSPLPSLTNNRMTESGVTYDGGAGTGPGNVTAIGGQTLTYDAFNQVVTKSANGNSPPDYTYIYDVNEERIGAQHGSSTTHWTIRDFDNKPLVAFDSPPASAAQTTWTWAESFAWAGGTMLMAERPIVGQLHYHVDHLGSTRVITDANGQLIAGGRSDYAPFGEEIPTANNEPMKFTGHERDYDLSNPTADTYLDYMHARYYDSRRGRFLSVDPGRYDPQDPQSWNRYTYVGNNPVLDNDPDGRERPYNPKRCFDYAGGNARMRTIVKLLDKGADILGDAFVVAETLVTVEATGGAGEPAAVEKLEADVAEVPALLENSATPSPSAAPKAEPSTDFVVTPNGEAIKVPDGAKGPNAPERGSGMSYQGGSGGKGMDSRTTGVRIMDANKNAGQRVNYMNKSGQTVNPASGKTIPNSDPAGHLPLKPFTPGAPKTK